MFFKKNLGEKKNEFDFLITFYISRESGIKIFLYYFINKCPKDTY